MAKKGKKINTCVPSCDYKPRLYLDLQDEDVSQVKELKIGEKATFMVTGKVVSLNQSERSDENEKQVKTGSISLEGYEVEVLDSSKNPFTEMADDDAEDA